MHQHRPRHHDGWHFDNGPRSYIHDEPFMAVDEYQSYRMMWLAVFGHHEDCEPLTCRWAKLQPPGAKPKQVRDV